MSSDAESVSEGADKTARTATRTDKRERGASKGAAKTVKGKDDDAGPAKGNRERVLVTSAAGGLGRLLCRKLHRGFDVLGVDRAPFPDRPKDVEHHEVDLRRKTATQLLKAKKPAAVVHIGGLHAPPKRGGPRLVDATVQLLKLVEQSKCRKLVLVSSATLYGASATSGSFITEEAPLLAASNVPALSEDISLDMMVQSFFWKRPETETVILRPVHLVGPHLDNLPTQYLKLRRVPTLLGFDPMVQLLHEDDMVAAIEKALQPGVRGVFNVTGQSQAPLSRLITARGAVPMPIPQALLAAAVSRATAWRLLTVDPGAIDFLRYSCLVDGGRAQQELGFTARRSLTETLADLD
jgi:UDP-glucose 4-epimerase